MSVPLRGEEFAALSPTATPSVATTYDSFLATNSESLSHSLRDPNSVEERGHHSQRNAEMLIASALLFGAVRVLGFQEIAEVSVNPTIPGSQLHNSWKELELGSGRPISWWLGKAGWLRGKVIADTAESLSKVLPGILQPIAKRGVSFGLNKLTDGNPFALKLNADLADSSSMISAAWAKHYAAKLGEGLGATSADGLLASMSMLQRANVAEDVAWKIVYSAAGLPPGQAMSVTQVAINRWNTMVGTRKPLRPTDLARDIGKLYLSRRGRSIYQNESEVAYNFGVQLTMMNAQKKGLLPADAKKVWVTAIDERVCPVCKPMDSVAVGIEEPFTVRAHTGVLNHEVRLWVPPAHPGCRCRVVPDSAIEHGIITRTARFSRADGRARLKSQLSDLVHDARPGWIDEAVNEDVDKGWVEALHPRGAAGKFALVGAAAAVGVGAAEVAHAHATHQQTKQGYAVTSGFRPRRKYRTVQGVTDAPVGTRFTKQSHPEGTYLVSMASLAAVRSHTSIKASENPAALRRSMQRNGFTHPVHMRIYDDAAELWDGNHRLNLAEELNISAVPVKVVHMSGRRQKGYTLSHAVDRIRQRRYRAKIVSRYTQEA